MDRSQSSERAGPSPRTRQRKNGANDLKERYQELRERIKRSKGQTVLNDEFEEIVQEFESSHASLQKLREQGEDAEVFRDYLHSLLEKLNGITAGEHLNTNRIISALQRNFGYRENETELHEESQSRSSSQTIKIDLEKLGNEVVDIFSIPPGFDTMVGPMEMEEKKKHQPAQRKARINPKEALVNPSSVNTTQEDESKKATDANVETMFKILRRYRSLKFMRLVLNRQSFAQTAENIFALSFLVKDGRVSLSSGLGDIVVEPTNPPTEEMRANGEAVRRQLCIKFEHKDWQRFKELVPEGEELMPCRPMDKQESASPTSFIENSASASDTENENENENDNDDEHENENVVDDHYSHEIKRKGKRKIQE